MCIPPAEELPRPLLEFADTGLSRGCQQLPPRFPAGPPLPGWKLYPSVAVHVRTTEQTEPFKLGTILWPKFLGKSAAPANPPKRTATKLCFGPGVPQCTGHALSVGNLPRANSGNHLDFSGWQKFRPSLNGGPTPIKTPARSTNLAIFTESRSIPKGSGLLDGSKPRLTGF